MRPASDCSDFDGPSGAGGERCAQPGDAAIAASNNGPTTRAVE